MHAPRDLGSNDGPPYEVVSIELDLAVRGAGHEPVRGVETLDPTVGRRNGTSSR